MIFRHNLCIIPAPADRGCPCGARAPALYNDAMKEEHLKFYAAWAELLEWMREYAEAGEHALFVKQADFTEYIYRMERPYQDRKSTRLNSSHVAISYAVFCLKKKKKAS